MSREQRERGETRSLKDVAADLDVNLEDEDPESNIPRQAVSGNMERRLVARELGELLLPVGMVVIGILGWIGYLSRSELIIAFLLIMVVTSIQFYLIYQRLYGE